MTDNTNMSETVKEVLDKIRSLADAKTVIGEPISLVGSAVTIIPVSKVSIGLGIGGRDSLAEKKKAGNTGGATGLTVTPVAFLVINADGEARLLNVGENSGYDSLGILSAVNGIDKALDKAPDILAKIKALLKKDGSDESRGDDGGNEKE